MTKRMSNFIFGMCVVGCISGILLAGITACKEQVEKPIKQEIRQNVPTTTLHETFWGKLVRVEVGDNTICYVYTGNSKGGISCLKQ